MEPTRQIVMCNHVAEARGLFVVVSRMQESEWLEKIVG